MRALRWVPALLFATGLVLVQTVDAQQRAPLRRPLDDAVSRSIAGFSSEDLTLPEDVERAAEVSDYLLRVYTDPTGAAFTVYVAYHESQADGSAIHSPRNCLPAAGFESIVATTARLVVDDQEVEVNQNLVRRGDEQALVLYWYQGRGRVAADELSIKWDLLRDAALHGRTEEALVRIVVPTRPSDDGVALAHRVAAAVIPMVDRALPTLD